MHHATGGYQICAEPEINQPQYSASAATTADGNSNSEVNVRTDYSVTQLTTTLHQA